MPCDLYNEHVNKLHKEAIHHMGANFSQKAFTPAARCITYMSFVATNFGQQCGITPECTTHHDVCDVKRITVVVRCVDLWKVKQGRKHRCLESNPLINLDRKKFKEWIQMYDLGLTGSPQRDNVMNIHWWTNGAK